MGWGQGRERVVPGPDVSHGIALCGFVRVVGRVVVLGLM